MADKKQALSDTSDPVVTSGDSTAPRRQSEDVRSEQKPYLEQPPLGTRGGCIDLRQYRDTSTENKKSQDDGENDKK